MLRHLPAACLLLAALVTANDTCYLRTDGEINKQNSKWFTCEDDPREGTSSSVCCMTGSTCGPDSLCRWDVENSDLDKGKFFVGGCTDKNYNDPACRKECTSNNATSIRWSAVNQFWSCCSETGCRETTNSDEHFKGLSPAEWWNRANLDDNNGSPFDDVNDNNDDDDGLTTAEIIGIAVGLGVLFLAMGVIGLIWYRVRGSKARKTHGGVKGKYEQIPIPNRVASPQPPVAASYSHSRSQSYAGEQMYSRSRSPSPMPSRGRFKEEVSDNEGGVPDPLLPGRGDAPQAPDQLSIFSRR